MRTHCQLRTWLPALPPMKSGRGLVLTATSTQLVKRQNDRDHKVGLCASSHHERDEKTEVDSLPALTRSSPGSHGPCVTKPCQRALMASRPDSGRGPFEKA